MNNKFLLYILLFLSLFWYFIIKSKYYPREMKPFFRVKDKVAKAYNLFAFWILYIGIVIGYLINVDSCRASHYFLKDANENTHFQCFRITEKGVGNGNFKFDRVRTECGCLADCEVKTFFNPN